MFFVGLIAGFEFFPLVLTVLLIAIGIKAAMMGHLLFHLIPWWGPGLLGMGIPILPFVVVQFLWKKTDTKEFVLPWVANAFWYLPIYLYVGYFILLTPWIFVISYLFFTILILGLLALFVPFVIFGYFDERSEEKRYQAESSTQDDGSDECDPENDPFTDLPF